MSSATEESGKGAQGGLSLDEPHGARLVYDSVCICIIVPSLPCGVGAATLETVFAIRDMYLDNGQRGAFSVVMVQGKSYENALAEVAGRAYQWTGANRFFFLDADIAFPVGWFVPFVTLDRPILVGTYQQRTSPQDWCVNNVDVGTSELELVTDPSGIRLLRISDTGFGAVMVKRETYRAMAKRYPELLYVSDHAKMKRPVPGLWDPFVFEHGGVRRRPAGDTCFFKRARDSGFEIWCLPDMPIDHAYMGPMSLMDWMAMRERRDVLEAQGLNGAMVADLTRSAPRPDSNVDAVDDGAG
jgi:hypothetical protein